MISAQNAGLTIFSPINRGWAELAFVPCGGYLAAVPRPTHPEKPANLRSWRVIIIRSKGEYLEAPDRERAEAAIKQFDLDNYQRPRLLIHSRAAIAPPTG
jgi:hypothetical protein